MKHKESDLQISCIKWFRAQYPAYAKLLFHPKNEGNGNRRQGAIHKAEGVVAGVANLMLQVPADFNTPGVQKYYTCLALEMKTKTGRQEPSQKIFQQYLEAAGGKYNIIRDLDTFCDVVTDYMGWVPKQIDKSIKQAYKEIEDEETARARAEFKKLLNK